MNKILIASPINKPPRILELFFKGLDLLSKENIYIDYCFINDNQNLESSNMVYDFIDKNGGHILKVESNYQISEWDKGEHNWSFNKIEKIAYFKNKIIEYFLKGSWDYIFFIDSDLILHPNTIKKLIADDKDIVANIFWTTWSEGGRSLPQVWLKDFYTLFNAHMLRCITNEQAIEEEGRFLEQLRVPGVYKVGGLGACTLIKRNVLEAGVHFGEIYNLSFWGEDRSFCIRAVAIGYELYVDTYNPAFHIFRETEIDSGKSFINVISTVNIK